MESNIHFQDPNPCPECGGKRIEAKGNGYMYLNKLNASNAAFFSGSRLLALVCINCGYTAIYAQDPQKLM